MEGNKTKRYRAIMADCPWDIDQRNPKYGAIKHYPLMTLSEIKAMPIADLAEPNAHLYLWVTNGSLPYGFDVIKAWGFQYRSCYTWVKPRLGMGNFIRSASEHVLFSIRGKAPVLYKSQPSWGFHPVQNHSHKPEEFHKIAERLSPGPYLELFARRRQPGWDIWGNDASITSDIEIPGYPVPNYKRREAA